MDDDAPGDESGADDRWARESERRPPDSEAGRDTDEWGVTADGPADRFDHDDTDRSRIPMDLSRSTDADGVDEADDIDADGSVPEPNSTPIESGDPDLENAIFVLIGAVLMLLVIVRLISIPLG